MSETLVNYVVGATDEQLLALSLEDIALSQAWYASYVGVASIRESCVALPGRVAQWTADKQDAGKSTHGARQQPILRSVLDRLLAKGPEILARDELDFLFFAYELIQRTKSRNQFQRPLDLMAPQMEAIKSLRETREAVRGLPVVLKQVGVATEASILAAPRRTIGNFGGLALSFRGPVLRHGGSLKIVGDVPDGAAVVVEGEACYVAGYVLGNLLVNGHTEVRDNISGLLISQRGNIRARGIVNRATVIAKLGRIRIGVAEGPELVYGGTQIRVDERTRLGRYIAPRIRVDGEVTGGEFTVTTRLQAERFNHAAHQPVELVLRSELVAEDYGETLPREAHTLQRTVKKLRNRLDHLHKLMTVQQEEAEHYASTALLYICSGKESQKELQAGDSLKRRRAFLIRILTGVHLLSVSLSERLQQIDTRGTSSSAGALSAERSIQSVLSEVSKELSQLKIEGEFPEELDREWSELMALHAASSRKVSESVLSQAILRFNEARKAWRSELDSLDRQTKQLQENLTRDATRKSLVERAQADGTSQTALAQLIRAAKQRGADDPVMQRIMNPFMKRMLTLMQKRNQWVERYRKEAGECRAEMTEHQNRLLDEFSVGSVVSGDTLQVKGSFAAGVQLFVEEKHPVMAGIERGTALVTPDTGHEVWKYTVTDGAVLRVTQA